MAFMPLTPPESLESFTPELPLSVALSGGADSCALLLASARKWPGQVTALHVHHGLQAMADEFERHCLALCARLDVPLRVAQVNARHCSGESPEDAARKARYKALAELAEQQQSACILLAQHADDQVETLLLALSRGAGLPGLAAMPVQFERHGARFYRPLLQLSGGAIRQWLAAQGVEPIHDPTNADTRFTRNKIRLQLLPALEAAFPQFRKTFARSAQHAAQAQSLLAELAQQDLLVVGMPPVIRALQQLSPARQANVLRCWLRQCAATPSAAQLAQLLGQVAACTTRGHQIHLKVSLGHVSRTETVLHYTPALQAKGSPNT